MHVFLEALALWLALAYGGFFVGIVLGGLLLALGERPR